ncbi:hypothetical protein [Cohnella sp. REN36]|uniref:hypothetical protein n=1 Tax=Cohnella sp. REN36 TaxID=2887347 RepID=UPI001D141239|nr:hypothetical protein [Cohnella sp. REN36]MCC3374085.1 hypothetical protein [Cohnella sp. REN36]
MISVLLWIIGLYAVAAACMHVWFRRRQSGKRQYVLVAGNHQREIEGYVRKLQWQAQRLGRDFGITVLLSPESTDDTAAIVERFARGDAGVGLVRQSADDAKRARTREDWERELAGDGAAPGQEQWIWVELPPEAVNSVAVRR